MARHLLLHFALVRDHYRLWRHRIELHNSGDNDNHDQQRIHCARPDADAYAHPDAYTNSDSRTTANPCTYAYANAHTRYSDNYVRR
jgi:hypothetical protein